MSFRNKHLRVKEILNLYFLILSYYYYLLIIPVIPMENVFAKKTSLN